MLPERMVLLTHLGDQSGDVHPLLFQHLDVLFILVLQLRLEVFNSPILGGLKPAKTCEQNLVPFVSGIFAKEKVQHSNLARTFLN